MDHALNVRTIDECRPLMRTGDVLLTRGTGFISACIRAFTGYEHTHASQLDATKRHAIKVHEVRELVGAQCVRLEDVVAANVGRVDWFRLDPHNRWPHINRDKMREKAAAWTDAKMPYGYLTVFLALLLHLPLVRWFTRRPTSDHKEWAIFPDCSAYLSGTQQAGGMDHVRHMSHRAVEPGHFANSLALEYEATLIP